MSFKNCTESSYGLDLDLGTISYYLRVSYSRSTPNMIFSVTYHLDLHSVVSFYY